MTSLTHGLNTQGGQVTQELNAPFTLGLVETHIAPVTGVVGDWFVRFGRDLPLQGPYTFNVADSHARFASVEEGYAEVVTYLGERLGDPITVPARLFVNAIYVEGRKFLGGRTAQYHSDKKLIEDLAKKSK